MIRIRRAFTLVELLVVISIVAILASLVMPSLHLAHSYALRTRCASHLKNIDEGLVVYAQDNDNILPGLPNPQYHNPSGIWFTYETLIAPYLGFSADPSDKTTQAYFTCPLDHMLAPAYPSYVFNGGNQYDAKFPGLAGRSLITVAQPTKTILVAEGSAVFPFSWHAPQGAGSAPFNNARNLAAFIDGHVDFIPFYSGGGMSASNNPPSGYDYKWSAD